MERLPFEDREEQWARDPRIGREPLSWAPGLADQLCHKLL